MTIISMSYIKSL